MRTLTVLIAGMLTVNAAAKAEERMACFGGLIDGAGNRIQAGAIGSYPVLNARDTLLGKTVTIAFYSESALRQGFSEQSSEFESERIVRVFSETSVTESSGGESVTYDITYEDANWCRTTTTEGRKECFSVIGRNPQALYETVVYRLTDQFCKVFIIGKIDGLTVPPSAFPVQNTGSERRRR